MKVSSDKSPQVRAFYSAALSFTREMDEKLPRRSTPPSDRPSADDLTLDGVELAPQSDARPG